MTDPQLKSIAYKTILDLSTDEGIQASGRDESYGCIFGRDSAITILKILKVLSSESTSEIDREILFAICRRGLSTLVALQGTQSNLSSGEEPGKFIHEYRKDKFDHLITGSMPWYVYPDGNLRNYDSLDSTPLALIAIYRYWKLTGDNEFLLTVLNSVETGLNWIITYGDKDKDYLLEYDFPKERIHGGLVVQSWTDSFESLKTVSGKMPEYPIAPVEVQGYAWLALRLWHDFFKYENNGFSNTKGFAHKLKSHADKLKEQFNTLFILKDQKKYFAAQALDGLKNQIATITGNPLLLLWATYERNGEKEAILDDKYVPDFVERGFKSDLFESDAGIRTMSTFSPTFDPTSNSYHNGSFWPKLNGMIHEGLTIWNYTVHASVLKYATLIPIKYFNSPIELYIKINDQEYIPYTSPAGQVSCRYQAWTAAVMLDLLSE